MIMKNQSIVCFAAGPWDSMWRNRHQIMSRLGKKNKVLYIEPQIQGIRATIGLLKRSIRNKKDKNESLKHIANGLWVYEYPYWVFKSQRFILRGLGILLRIFAIIIVLKKLKMKSPILWVVEPRFGDVIKYLEKSLVCYHVVDNYAEAPYYPETIRKELAKTDKIMLSIADLVIVTSPFLLKEKSKHHRNVHLVKNAVDYERFAALHSSNNFPKDMEHIPKPIIGYVGAVNEKLDYELLDTITRKRPQWSFVFIGDYYNPSSPAYYKFVHEHTPNVFLLGRRDVMDVPPYIHGCDVCIMPYRRDDYVEAIDSLKLYEYFACEKPVVATNIAAVREHSQVVYIAEDANDFMVKLEKAMQSHTHEQRNLQRAIAMQNTWDKRVEQLSIIIQATLNKL